MTKKTTKRALLLSVLSMMLCVAMLVGSTFAWFTDSVTSGKNKIIAGNLDVELDYAVLNDDGSIKEWKSVEGESLFDENALWEPGYTQVVYLKVSNVGTLSLNYKLAVTVDDEHEGSNKDGQRFKLSDHLKFGAVTDWNGTVYADRTAARAAIGEAGKLKNYSATGSIKAGEAEQYIALVVYMPEDVGNVANYKSYIPSAVPYIDLGISLFATQMMDENDSFGNDYDKNAFQNNEQTPAEENAFTDLDKDTFTVKTEADLLKLQDLVLNGTTFESKTITLANDITLTQANWTPIGTATSPFMGTFDGAEKTISGLNINKTLSDSAEVFCGALFGYVKNASIKNLRLAGAINVTGTAFGVLASGIAAQTAGNTSFSNCVSDVNITIDVEGEAIASGIAINANLYEARPYLTVSKCVNNGNISVVATKMSMAGGILGLCSSSQGYNFKIDTESKNNGTLTADIFGDLYCDIDKM